MMRRILTALTLMGTLGVQAQRMDNVTEHSKYVKAVDEYVPAPGQQVNVLPEATEGDTPATMAAKCTKVLQQNAAKLASGQGIDTDADDDDYDDSYLITLGAYGGYITFHFDHSIANVEGQPDLLILGNSTKNLLTTLDGGASEPGIVMVSRDDNGNGLPDDAWYELAGSADADSVGKVVYGYELTYTRKPMENIPWADNQGATGVVTRIGFHKQEYYPLWLGDQLTFKGTLLPQNGIDSNGVGTNWVRMFLRNGYVDNKPNSDAEANSFDIGRAVDEHRQPVRLDFIDFVRVYTAVNQFCGWMGETSTEVAHAEDLHLGESLNRIRTAVAGIREVQSAQAADAWHDLQGRKTAPRRKGLYIRNGRKYVIQ